MFFFLLKFEILMWVRSKRFFAMIAAFVFSGVTSTIIAYYANDILASVSGLDLKSNILPNPQWNTLLQSYFKNVSQLILLLAMYLLNYACNLKGNKSLQLFYKSRANSSGILYGPKIISGIFVVIISSVLGGLVALYIIWAFFNNMPIGKIILLLTLQILTIVVFCLVSVMFTIWTKMPFLSSLLIIILVFISNVGFIEKWSPSIFLFPNQLFYGNFSWLNYGWNLLSLSLVAILSVILLIVKPVKKYKTKKFLI